LKNEGILCLEAIVSCARGAGEIILNPPQERAFLFDTRF